MTSLTIKYAKLQIMLNFILCYQFSQIAAFLNCSIDDRGWELLYVWILLHQTRTHTHTYSGGGERIICKGHLIVCFHLQVVVWPNHRFTPLAVRRDYVLIQPTDVHKHSSKAAFDRNPTLRLWRHCQLEQTLEASCIISMDAEITQD